MIQLYQTFKITHHQRQYKKLINPKHALNLKNMNKTSTKITNR